MLLVTGATGVVGREVVRLLVERGFAVAAVTRDPSADVPAGAHRVHPGDVEALDALDGVLLSPRATGPRLAETLAHARAAGAKRAVLLSAVTVAEPAGLPRFRTEFQNAENAVTGSADSAGSGADWTALRCTDFAANSLAWAGQIRDGGIVRGAYAAARTSTVDERDVAAVAILALTEPGHAGQTYTLTGEDSLSQPEKVAAIGAAIGRPVTFAELPPDAVRRGMLAAGLPDEVPDRLLGSLADYARRPGPTTDTVRRLLGRPARTFATWAADHRAAFSEQTR